MYFEDKDRLHLFKPASEKKINLFRKVKYDPGRDPILKQFDSTIQIIDRLLGHGHTESINKERGRYVKSFTFGSN